MAKSGNFPPLDPATELIQSFYLKDLEQIQNKPTKNVEQYVLAMLQKRKERVSIDHTVQQMQQWVKPEVFPLGLWPSSYSPSLMQQIAINLAISQEQSIFSVNGPPGTGKPPY